MEEPAKTLPLGGIVYTLQASRPLRAYHGTWKCPVCESSTDCGVYSSAQAAFEAAEQQARLHHANVHQVK